jgi:threonine/homoserine/homoserine lactone efflux protein
MSRNRILATGAVLWTVVAADGLAHLAAGDWVAAALMATVGIACVAWVAVRRRRNQPEGA